MNIKVNSKTYIADEKETVWEFLNNIGIKIPKVCHIKNYTEGGHCKACIVEINGIITTSCDKKIKDGMNIITNSVKVQKARQWAINLLLARHPAVCYDCHKMGSCKLAEAFMINGKQHPQHLKPKALNPKKEPVTDNISRDFSKCVYCGFCNNKNNLKEDKVDLCPTGALYADK